MTKHNPSNERIKRQYFTFLKEAKRHSEATVDAAADALARFETATKHRDFKAFHFEQAVAFKNRLAAQRSQQSGKPLSQATRHATLTHLKRFFQWLAGQPGYKSRLKYSDAEYFNLSDKDTRVATARRETVFPTLEQVRHVIGAMPRDSEIQRRNRALVAFTLLTGARDSAIASMKLKHIDLAAGSVCQDAREVNTKFSKTFTTYFFPVGEDIRKNRGGLGDLPPARKAVGKRRPALPGDQCRCWAGSPIPCCWSETRALEYGCADPGNLPRGVHRWRIAVLQSAQCAEYAGLARRGSVPDAGAVQGVEPESGARGRAHHVHQLRSRRQ